jgi:hypothetical protein
VQHDEEHELAETPPEHIAGSVYEAVNTTVIEHGRLLVARERMMQPHQDERLSTRSDRLENLLGLPG